MELEEQGMLVWRFLPAHVAEWLARETGNEYVCPLIAVIRRGIGGDIWYQRA